jgi:catechol 2,3-dioxygenase-like lactoylglutathione lyase family enzyme
MARDSATETMRLERPSIAIGHVTLTVSDVVRSAGFYKALGIRAIVEREGIAILELRGAHLLPARQRQTAAPGGPHLRLHGPDADAFRDLGGPRNRDELCS